MTVNDAIHAYTIGAAYAGGMDHLVGSIEPGKLADIIATRVNPLSDISALKSVCFVMKDGQIAKPLAG